MAWYQFMRKKVDPKLNMRAGPEKGIVLFGSQNVEIDPSVLHETPGILGSVLGMSF